MCTNAASRARDDDPPLRLWRWRDTPRTRSAIFRLSRRAEFTSVINLKTIVRHSRARDLAVARRQGDTHAIYDRDDLMPERIELMQFGLTRSMNCAATADQSSRSPDHGCCWPDRQIA